MPNTTRFRFRNKLFLLIVQTSIICLADAFPHSIWDFGTKGNRCKQFFVCFRFQFPTAPASTPFLSSSNRVQPIAEGYFVRLLDKDNYRIKRINPATQTVVLQKTNSVNRCSARPTTEVWLPLHLQNLFVV